MERARKGFRVYVKKKASECENWFSNCVRLRIGR